VWIPRGAGVKFAWNPPTDSYRFHSTIARFLREQSTKPARDACLLDADYVIIPHGMGTNSATGFRTDSARSRREIHMGCVRRFCAVFTRQTRGLFNGNIQSSATDFARIQHGAGVKFIWAACVDYMKFPLDKRAVCVT